MAHSQVHVLLAPGSITARGLTGRFLCCVVGTFGGGSLQFEYSPDDGVNWVAIPGGPQTTSGVFESSCGVGGLFRATLTGGSGVNLSVSFGRVVP